MLLFCSVAILLLIRVMLYIWHRSEYWNISWSYKYLQNFIKIICINCTIYVGFYDLFLHFRCLSTELFFYYKIYYYHFCFIFCQLLFCFSMVISLHQNNWFHLNCLSLWFESFGPALFQAIPILVHFSLSLCPPLR